MPKAHRKRWKELSSKEKGLRICDIFFILFLLGMAFGVNPILQSTLETENPVVVVISESMEPTIYRGDILFVKYKAPAKIEAGSHINRTGDIIIFDTHGVWSAYDAPEEPVVHRVVGKFLDNSTGKFLFMTHGDNNPRVDPPTSDDIVLIPEEKVMGVVVGRIPIVGHFKIWLTDLEEDFGISPIIMIIIIAIGVILTVNAIEKLFKSLKKTEPKETPPIEENSAQPDI